MQLDVYVLHHRKAGGGFNNYYKSGEREICVDTRCDWVTILLEHSTIKAVAIENIKMPPFKTECILVPNIPIKSQLTLF